MHEPAFSERHDIFRALVELQDRGVGVNHSRQIVCRRFGVEEWVVAEVEQEGIEEDWPPLDG
jgi:hypothetical protein